MPLVSRNGPAWTRPIVKNAEKRLWGLNPAVRFLAAIFRSRAPKAVAAAKRGDDPENGAAGAGVGSPRVPPQPSLSRGAARQR